MSKWAPLITVIIAGLLIMVWLNIRIPADVDTRSRLFFWAVQIHDYVELNGKIPGKLSSIPKREGYDNSVKDGWGRALLYSHDEDGTITITSYGKDGKPGGKGDNEDMSVSYNPFDGESYYAMLGVQSPMSFTKLKLGSIEGGIRRFYLENGGLPEDLRDLGNPDPRLFDNADKDNWGNEIIYCVESNSVTLTSLGKDGKAGGTGENTDIVVSFSVD